MIIRGICCLDVVNGAVIVRGICCLDVMPGAVIVRGICCLDVMHGAVIGLSGVSVAWMWCMVL